MKRIIPILLALITAVCLCTAQAAALEHAEWDAVASEDGNYRTFNGASADYVIDGGMETAWQKQADIMDANGVISKECYVSLTWQTEMQIESVSIWWRTSTRCEASKDGYLLQYGTKEGASIKWKDVDAVYNYNSRYQSDRGDDRYYSCDTVSFNSPLTTKMIRVLVKKGVDTERGYSPKINEIEVIAQPGESEPVGPTVISTPSEEPVSSDEPVSSEESASSDEPVSSEEAVSSEESLSSEEPVSSTAPVQSSAESANEPYGGYIDGFLPWIILAAAAAAVIVISIVIIARENKFAKNK